MKISFSQEVNGLDILTMIDTTNQADWIDER